MMIKASYQLRNITTFAKCLLDGGRTRLHLVTRELAVMQVGLEGWKVLGGKTVAQFLPTLSLHFLIGAGGKKGQVLKQSPIFYIPSGSLSPTGQPHYL